MAKRTMRHGEYIRVESALNRLKPNPWPKMTYRNLSSRTCEVEFPELNEEEMGVLIAELLMT